MFIHQNLGQYKPLLNRLTEIRALERGFAGDFVSSVRPALYPARIGGSDLTPEARSKIIRRKGCLRLSGRP